jgi:thioredoxin 1
MKSTLRHAIHIVLLAAGLAFATSQAAEVGYDKARFDAALAEGKPVIVDFAASWCPTCRAQKPIVDELLKEPRMQGVTLFRADFDTEKDLKSKLHVVQQSTFVVFKGGKEVARSTGQTAHQAIADLFAQAL